MDVSPLSPQELLSRGVDLGALLSLIGPVTVSQDKRGTFHLTGQCTALSHRIFARRPVSVECSLHETLPELCPTCWLLPSTAMALYPPSSSAFHWDLVRHHLLRLARQDRRLDRSYQDDSEPPWGPFNDHVFLQTSSEETPEALLPWREDLLERTRSRLELHLEEKGETYVQEAWECAGLSFPDHREPWVLYALESALVSISPHPEANAVLSTKVALLHGFFLCVLPSDAAQVLDFPRVQTCPLPDPVTLEILLGLWDPRDTGVLSTLEGASRVASSV